MNIRISLDTKFQLKITILSFLSKFAQEGHFRSKTEKANTSIEFFDLAPSPNFLNI